MKGGLKPIVRIKCKKQYQVTYTEFALNLIRDTLAKLNIPKLKKGGDFVTDFTSWIKMYADPIHDFKMSHKTINKSLIQKLLIRMYNNILEKTPSDFENQVLIRLLKDPNTYQGISLKHCQFYRLKEDTDMDLDDESLWKHIEESFNQIDPNVGIKFYILNANIQGTGTKEFTHEYKKIVPLSAYWDPFKASEIDFIVNKRDFYNKIYDQINNELYVATKIRFRIEEGKTSREIIFHLQAPNNHEKTISIERQGFSIKEIKLAIDELSNKEDISNEILKELIDFLKQNNASINEIISFLLVLKMSGDMGCVYFIKELDKFRGEIRFNDTIVDFNVQNKPITFLYTTDRLAGAAAIANNVKCVIRCKPLNDSFICQFTGSKSKLHDSMYEPYLDVLENICKIDFRQLNEYQRDHALFTSYFRLFVATFPGHHFTVKHKHRGTEFSQEVLNRLEFTEQPIQNDDDRVKHILAILSLYELKNKLGSVIEYILKEHLRKAEHIISLQFLNSIYRESHFFDPLLQFFMDTLIIPNESIKEFVYKYITHEIETHIGLAFTKNYHSLLDMREKEKEINTEELEEDIGMIDAQIYKDQQKQRRQQKQSNTSRSKKSKNKYEDDPDYVPSD